MSIERNKQVARDFVDAVQAGDMERTEALQHPDCTWWVVGRGDLGRDLFNALVRGGVERSTARTITITAMTAEGDRVAYEAVSEMVFPDCIYRNFYHNLLVIRDGLIVAGREYMDTMAAVQAGLRKSPETQAV
jgi:ketosteroid isomerase-like protein